MLVTISAWLRSRLLTTLFSVAICCGVVGPESMAIGQEITSSPTSPELSHDLQGMQFVGPLSVDGEANPIKDTLSFKDGNFSSQACLTYGFAPAPYWVRRDAKGLHFRAELQSPERGTMEFEGVFDGGEMLATALWTKERWYWTIEQKFQFRGHPLQHAK